MEDMSMEDFLGGGFEAALEPGHKVKRARSRLFFKLHV